MVAFFSLNEIQGSKPQRHNSLYLGDTRRPDGQTRFHPIPLQPAPQSLLKLQKLTAMAERTHAPVIPRKEKCSWTMARSSACCAKTQRCDPKRTSRTYHTTPKIELVVPFRMHPLESSLFQDRNVHFLAGHTKRSNWHRECDTSRNNESAL
jgi:hypothetical protein